MSRALLPTIYLLNVDIVRVDEQKTAEMNTSTPKSDKMMKYEGKDEKWLCKKCLKTKFAEKHEEDCSKCKSLKKDEVSLPIDYFAKLKFSNLNY